MLNQLRYFQSVVRSNSFTVAAEENHISQSAISQQIKALEAELGTQLIKRYGRRFELTPAGERFYKKSLLIVADYDRLCQEITRAPRADDETLRVGYLKCFSGSEFHRAVVAFSAQYPEVDLQLIGGNHEELSQGIRDGLMDMVFMGQRRAFSTEYANFSLAEIGSFIEVAARNPIAYMDSITPEDLKNTPCILVASQGHEESERDFYYHSIGFRGEFLFADTLKEARLMVARDLGFMPAEGGGLSIPQFGGSLVRVPLYRGSTQITRHYCAFWLADKSGYYIEEFAGMLKAEFEKQPMLVSE